jgi:hypothetical protein
MKIKITEERFKQILKEEMEALAVASRAPAMEEEAAPDMFDEPDEEGGMARGELFKIAKYGQEVRDMLKDDDQLPAWVQSKITKCAAMMGDVKHFLEGQMAGQSDEMAPEQEPEEDEEVELGGDENLEEIVQSALDEVLNEKKKKTKVKTKKKVNPWAVCTASVGRKDKDKYESCVMGVKSDQGMK